MPLSIYSGRTAIRSILVIKRDLVIEYLSGHYVAMSRRPSLESIVCAHRKRGWNLGWTTWELLRVASSDFHNSHEGEEVLHMRAMASVLLHNS